jgi:hypothetical protein
MEIKLFITRKMFLMSSSTDQGEAVNLSGKEKTSENEEKYFLGELCRSGIARQK